MAVSIQHCHFLWRWQPCLLRRTSTWRTLMHNLTCLKTWAENGVKWNQNQTYDLLYVKKIYIVMKVCWFQIKAQILKVCLSTEGNVMCTISSLQVFISSNTKNNQIRSFQINFMRSAGETPSFTVLTTASHLRESVNNSNFSAIHSKICVVCSYQKDNDWTPSFSVY